MEFECDKTNGIYRIAFPGKGNVKCILEYSEDPNGTYEAIIHSSSFSLFQRKIPGTRFIEIIHMKGGKDQPLLKNAEDKLRKLGYQL